MPFTLCVFFGACQSSAKYTVPALVHLVWFPLKTKACTKKKTDLLETLLSGDCVPDGISVFS